MHWDWLKWFQFWKVESLDTIEPIATSVLCQFMTIKIFFQIDLHIMCTSGYIFVCKFWKAYLVFFMTIYAISLGSSSFIFVD